MDIKSQVQQMDQMVSQGDIVNAVKTFFSEEANTSDYNQSSTSGKAQMVEKMETFLGGIANVNGIKHHQTLINDHVSTSEFTFDFDMKDGSKVYWHEIISRKWNDEGKVIHEEYFLANA